MGFIAGATQFTAQQVGGSGICAAIGGLAVGPWVAERTVAAPPVGCNRALLQNVEHYVSYICGLTYDRINGPGVDRVLVSQVPVYITMIVFGLIGWAIGWLIVRRLVGGTPTPATQTTAPTTESKEQQLTADRAVARAPKQQSARQRRGTTKPASSPADNKPSETKPRPTDPAN